MLGEGSQKILRRVEKGFWCVAVVSFSVSCSIFYIEELFPGARGFRIIGLMIGEEMSLKFEEREEKRRETVSARSKALMEGYGTRDTPSQIDARSRTN
jgi:hypothetical protein